MVASLFSPLSKVVFEHAQEASFLWSLRTHRRRASGFGFEDLELLDGRLAAHVDGLHISGEHAWRACRPRLVTEAPGEMFAAMLVAIEARDPKKVNALLALSEVASGMAAGCVGALGWISA